MQFRDNLYCGKCVEFVLVFEKYILDFVGLREGGKEQKATKSRDSSIITPREFFDENDYY